MLVRSSRVSAVAMLAVLAACGSTASSVTTPDPAPGRVYLYSQVLKMAMGDTRAGDNVVLTDTTDDNSKRFVRFNTASTGGVFTAVMEVGCSDCSSAEASALQTLGYSPASGGTKGANFQMTPPPNTSPDALAALAEKTFLQGLSASPSYQVSVQGQY